MRQALRAHERSVRILEAQQLSPPSLGLHPASVPHRMLSVSSRWVCVGQRARMSSNRKKITPYLPCPGSGVSVQRSVAWPRSPCRLAHPFAGRLGSLRSRVLVPRQAGRGCKRPGRPPGFPQRGSWLFLTVPAISPAPREGVSYSRRLNPAEQQEGRIPWKEPNPNRKAVPVLTNQGDAVTKMRWPLGERASRERMDGCEAQVRTEPAASRRPPEYTLVPVPGQTVPLKGAALGWPSLHGQV